MSSKIAKVEKATEFKFNYEVFDSQKGIELKQATAKIKEKLRRTSQDIWEIGEMLSEVQSKLQRGQFDQWIKAEFDWSRRTAYKFISVYKRFDPDFNLEEIDIATSALYVLAAESTPEKIRTQFINKAQQGEKISHQEVLKVVKKAQQDSTSTTKITPLPTDITEKSPTVSLVQQQQPFPISSQRPIEKPERGFSIDSKPSSQTISISIGGWYELGEKHRLFFGDTASPEFYNSIPYASLAVAITADDWAHDWLIEKAKTLVVFPESEFDRQKLTGLIVMFSYPKDKIIFPWLPNAEMLSVAHELERQVYAGDINAEKCQAAIEPTGLSLKKAA